MKNSLVFGLIFLKRIDYDAIDKRLLRARQKVIGKDQKSRNDFDPKTVLGDSDIIVLDSNDLSEGWKERIE